MIKQAKRQVEAANGTPIQWVCQDKELVNALRKIFSEDGTLKYILNHIEFIKGP